MTTELNQEETDPRVLAAAAALRKHYATEDPMVESFPDDEYICCARIALAAAESVGESQ